MIHRQKRFGSYAKTNTMDHVPARDQYGAQARGVENATYSEGLRQHMLRVYNYMSIGVGLTGLVAWLVAQSPALMSFFYTQPMFWITAFAPLAFLLIMQWRMETKSVATLQTMFWLFCGVMGLSMAGIFMVYTSTSIARVFFITAGMFAAMSLYGYTTKRDLTSWGSFLFMGVIGLLIGGIVNIFVQSEMMHFVLSAIGVLVFTGLTAYDTQTIKETYAQSHGQEANQKFAVLGALRLYLDFILLFQYLLSLLGNRE